MKTPRTTVEDLLQPMVDAKPIVVSRPTLDVLEELLGRCSDAITVADAEGRCTYASGAIVDLMGLKPEEVVGYPSLGYIHPSDLDRLVLEVSRQAEDETGPQPIVYRQRGPKDVWRRVESRFHFLPEGHPLGIVIVNTRDVSDRVEAEAAHRETQDIIRMVAEGAALPAILSAVTRLVERRCPGGVAAVTAFDRRNGTLSLLAAPSLPESLGNAIDGEIVRIGTSTSAQVVRERRPVLSRVVATGSRQRDRHSSKRADAWSCRSIPLQANGSSTILGTLDLYRTDGSVPSMDDCALMAAAGELATVALARAAGERELAHRATHDGLTGLPNRALLYDRIDMALNRRRRGDSAEVAVLFIDLDNFKLVNDRLGHDAGDAVLSETARRLVATARSVDTVARLGGDEFIVLAETTDPAVLARRINEAIAEPFTAAAAINVTCSIGIASWRDYESPDELLNRADRALYRVKASGRNGYASAPLAA